MSREPAVIVGGLVTAILALLVAFGVPITDNQSGAVLSLAVILAPLLSSVVIRHFVTPAKGRHRADPPTI